MKKFEPTLILDRGLSCNDLLVQDNNSAGLEAAGILPSQVECVSLVGFKLEPATTVSSKTATCAGPVAITYQETVLNLGGATQKGCFTIDVGEVLNVNTLIGYEFSFTVQSSSSTFTIDYTVTSGDITPVDADTTLAQAIQRTLVTVLTKMYQTWLDDYKTTCDLYQLTIPECVTLGTTSDCFLGIESLVPGVPFFVTSSLDSGVISDTNFIFTNSVENECNFSIGGNKTISIGNQDVIALVKEVYVVNKPAYGRLCVTLNSSYPEDSVVILNLQNTPLPSVPYTVMSNLNATVAAFVDTFNAKMNDFIGANQQDVFAVQTSTNTLCVYFSAAYLSANTITLASVILRECNQAGVCSAATGGSITSSSQNYSSAVTTFYQTPFYAYASTPNLEAAYVMAIQKSGHYKTNSPFDEKAARIASYIESINLFMQQGDYNKAMQLIVDGNNFIRQSSCC